MDKEFVNPTVKEFISFLEQCDPESVVCTSYFDGSLNVHKATLDRAYEKVVEYENDEGEMVIGKAVCITI